MKFVLLLTILFVGCKSSQDYDLTSNEKVQASQQKIEGCQTETPGCSSINAPVFCETKIKLASKVSGFKTFHSWGKNNCLAREAMNRIFCKEKLKDKYVGWNNCIPDASEQNCPQSQYNLCPKNKVPYRCFAGYYQNQLIPSNMKIEAKGSNECNARQNIRQAACEKNLNPNLLKFVSCTKIKNEISEKK